MKSVFGGVGCDWLGSIVTCPVFRRLEHGELKYLGWKKNHKVFQKGGKKVVCCVLGDGDRRIRNQQTQRCIVHSVFQSITEQHRA